MTLALRSPNEVMRLSRLGSLHQSRLSFMRQLTRRMVRENWRFTRPMFDIDDNGVGVAVYTVHAPKHDYSLVAFANYLPADLRSDRVIATAWDATFCLHNGIPTSADIERLRPNVPKQEAGRITEKELSLSRANRSVRMWDYIVGSLAEGKQPDMEEIKKVGYLMRTTAVYGSGKFGAADYAVIANRPECQSPFQAELLSVYLTRAFVRDLVNHMAKIAGGKKSVKLNDKIATYLGIGNSTGLGMAPFIVNHPQLFNNWIIARENALATVIAIKNAKPDEIKLFQRLFHLNRQMVDSWHSDHPLQIKKIKALKDDINNLTDHFSSYDFAGDFAWQKLIAWAKNHLSEEGQEWLASLILEPYGNLVDKFGDEMAYQYHYTRLDGTTPLSEIKKLIEEKYDWALKLDWDDKNSRARVWYVSEEKLEPRLGERYEEDLDPYEQPLASAYDAVMLYQTITQILHDKNKNQNLAEFLTSHPEHRHAVRRLYENLQYPYSEIRDNIISSELLPIDMLRAKLSFFGATKFDPRSDRWVRIAMYAGAPYPESLNQGNADFWVYGIENPC